jgi:hypothetical protein
MAKDHHADGQKDGSKGKHDPPHRITPLDGIVEDKRTFDKLVKDNKEYDAGYKNARKQK